MRRGRWIIRSENYQKKTVDLSLDLQGRRTTICVGRCGAGAVSDFYEDV